MQFLYPGFLWALTALAIPVILHLFYFRRYKTVYFSNLRFLREVREETSARNKLRNLLILLARLLALGALILAFAQPIIPLRDKVQAGIRNVSIFVDNSFSMQSFGAELSLLDRARQKAREVIMGYGQEDKFQLLGHDLGPAQNQWISRDDALQRLEEWDFTPDVRPLSVIRGRQQQAFAGQDGLQESWMLSDFQQSIMDLSPADTQMRINLLPLRGVQEKNVAIDTAWFESPVVTLNQSVSLFFTLRNYSPDAVDNIRVSVVLDGQERPEGTLDIAGGGTITDTIQLTVMSTGWHTAAIRISDYPVTFDDTWYLAYHVEEKRNILVVNDRKANPRIAAVFAQNPYFELTEVPVGQITFDRLPEYQLVILNEPEAITSGLSGALARYIQEGGNVLFVPAASGDLAAYNAFLQANGARTFGPWRDGERAAGRINTETFVYRDVFRQTRPNMRLPKVSGSFTASGSGTSGESLLAFRDGGDLATFYARGKGALAVLHAPLDEQKNDLALQPEVFVPLLYKLAIYTSDARPLAYMIGKDDLIGIDLPATVTGEALQVTGPAEFLPGLSRQSAGALVDVSGQIKEAGFYTLVNGEEKLAVFGFNYDRTESDLAVADLDAFGDDGALTVWDETDETDLTELIQGARQGKPLWRWCIIFALAFLGLEIALIRLWKSGGA